MEPDRRPPVPVRIIMIVALLVVGSYTIAILHGLEKILWETMMTGIYCWYAVCSFHILMLATDFPTFGKPRLIGWLLGGSCLVAALWLLIVFPAASKLMLLFMVACSVPTLVHGATGRYIFHREHDSHGSG